MKENFLKYLIASILIAQVLLLGYLSVYFFVNDTIDNYDDIIIVGNRLLSEEKYYEYIISKEQSKEVSLNSIKTKIESHPYVLYADVYLTDNNSIEVSLKEKNFYVTVIKDGKPYFISENFEMVKVIPYTNNVSLPILVSQEKFNEKNVKSANVIVAFKVIDTLIQLNKELFERLSEINLNNDFDAILLFKNLRAPIYIRKNNLVKELVALNELLNDDKNLFLDESVRYIDLRFNNQIIIG